MSHRGNPFEGGDRSPSLGQWPEESYEEEKKLKGSGVQKAREYESANKSEDELIEMIDESSHLGEHVHGREIADPQESLDDNFANEEDIARAEEQEHRAKKYAEQVELRSAGVLPVDSRTKGSSHMSSREVLSAKDIADRVNGKEGKAIRRHKKRNDSQERVGLKVHIKQAQKDSLERRVSI